MSMRIDVTGLRFGKLVAISRIGSTNESPLLSNRSNQDSIWACRCDCGSAIEARLSNLRQGKQISCGCVGRARSDPVLHEKRNVVSAETQHTERGRLDAELLARMTSR